MSHNVWILSECNTLKQNKQTSVQSIQLLSSNHCQANLHLYWAFTAWKLSTVMMIVQYGELFPQCVYCFLMKRCWQPAYNNFFQGNSNKTILVASYFPACQFQFMRTKKKFIHYNKRTHFLSRRTLQLCPTFHSAQSTPCCLTGYPLNQWGIKR